MHQKWRLWGSLILSQSTSPAPGTDSDRENWEGLFQTLGTWGLPTASGVWLGKGLPRGSCLEPTPHHKHGQGPMGPCKALASEALRWSGCMGRGPDVPLNPWHVDFTECSLNKGDTPSKNAPNTSLSPKEAIPAVPLCLYHIHQATLLGALGGDSVLGQSPWGLASKVSGRPGSPATMYGLGLAFSA